MARRWFSPVSPEPLTRRLPLHSEATGFESTESIELEQAPVKRVLEALAVYPNPAELKQQYPELEDEDIRQALAYAATLVPGQHDDISAAS